MLKKIQNNANTIKLILGILKASFDSDPTYNNYTKNIDKQFEMAKQVSTEKRKLWLTKIEKTFAN